MRNPDRAAFLRAWANPKSVVEFAPDVWNDLMMQARSANVLARLSYRIEDAGVFADCPLPVQDMLIGALPYPRYLHTHALRELRHLRLTLNSLGTDLILLKGGAYLVAGLPLSRGRTLRDLDILVRREEIELVESRLLEAGWESQVENAYDQRYYRDWMHEIPPLRHPERGWEVDIHHTVIPLTSRLHPNPALFWEASLPVDGMPGVRVLAPADMVLHTTTHLFYDGEIRGGLGDLLDIDSQLRLFGLEPGFWDKLLERAAEMQLGRPLYYGLRFAHRLLETPVPREAMTEARARFSPPWAIEQLMDRLVTRVLTADPGAPTPVSDWLLYVRSHWLRMPPHLLIPHLTRKALRRLPSTRAVDEPEALATETREPRTAAQDDLP